MTPSKALFYGCISFILGIFVQLILYHIGYAKNQGLVLGFLVLGILIITVSLALRKNHYIIFGFCAWFLVLGMLRVQISQFYIERDTLQLLNDAPEKITLIGKIIGEPDMRDSVQKLKVKINNSVVLVSTSVYPKYQYLDTLQVTGKLKTPAVFEDFNYRQYLLKDGIYSVMDYATVELVSDKHEYTAFSFIYEKILILKKTLITSVNLHFSLPYNTMVSGIVYGDDKTMPQDLKDKFNATGLSHVTAVSGSNIVILISVVMFFLLTLGLWRQQALYISLIFIWFYILLVAFPASAIRAGIMGSAGLVAQNLGRQNTSWRVIVIAAALMLLQNPFLLLYDIGFQLSFLASLGIIYIYPMLDYFFTSRVLEKMNLKKENTNSIVKNAASIIFVTLSAQILALPIIMYNFGTISIISLVTNLLILPIIPLIMIFGFLVSALGIVWYYFGWFFSLPCWILLTYFLRILDIFSKPWAVLQIQNVSWIWLLGYYAVVFLVIFWLRRFQKSKFLGQ